MTDDRHEVRHLETLVGYVLRRAEAAVSRMFLNTFADLGVRPTQLGVLSVLEVSPGCRPSRLGALLGIKRANVGPLLETLERRGLVRREPSLDDRRAQSLFLTRKGAALLTELHRREAEFEARIATALSPAERTQLLGLLRRVASSALAETTDEQEGAAA